MSTEAAKFMAWYEAEQAKGLVDVKFFVGDVSEATSEKFFQEVNTMNNADSVAQPEYHDSVERRPASELLGRLFSHS